MRSIGNIERFLVIGIVVVIGAILAVAIRGADDLNSAYSDKVAKSKTGDPKKGGNPGLRIEAPRTNPATAGGHAELKSPDPKAGETLPTTLSPELQKALEDKLKAANGQKPAVDGTGGKSDAPKSEPAKPLDDKGAGLAAAPPAPIDEAPPVALEDDSKASPVGKAPGEDAKSNAPSDEKAGGARPAPAALEWTYEVQPGDRLERIATSLYGERNMWKEIAAANPSLSDPTRIKVGMKLTLPKDPVNTAVVGLSHGANPDGRKHVTVPDHLLPKDDAKSSEPKVASQAPADKSTTTKTTGFKRVTSSDQYQVQRGDTLMAIAATHYGTRSAWRMILDANTDVIPDKDHIKPGITIKLPAQ